MPLKIVSRGVPADRPGSSPPLPTPGLSLAITDSSVACSIASRWFHRLEDWMDVVGLYINLSTNKQTVICLRRLHEGWLIDPCSLFSPQDPEFHILCTYDDFILQSSSSGQCVLEAGSTLSGDLSNSSTPRKRNSDCSRPTSTRTHSKTSLCYTKIRLSYHASSFSLVSRLVMWRCLMTRSPSWPFRSYN